MTRKPYNLGRYGVVRTRRYAVVALVLMAGVFGSCTFFGADESGYTRKQRAYLKLCPSRSKAGFIVKDGLLGIMPLHCGISEMGNIVSDAIGTNLLDSDFRVIERTYLTKMLQEQGLGISGAAEELDYARVRKISNVNYLLMGTIAATELRYGFTSYTNFSGATVRIFDVTTGEVVISVVCRTAKWKDPAILGEAIATAIKKELGM